MRTPILSALLLLGVSACADSTEPAAPAPEVVEIVAGNEQETLATEAHLADPLRVRVTDGEGRPVAGVPVQWSATIGPITPWDPVTDESGMAAAGWTLGDSWPRTLGTHNATATVAGAGSVTFTGYLRRGLLVHDLSFSPAEVDVTAGAAPVVVRVRAANDFGSIDGAEVTFRSPSGDETIREFQPFERVEGSIHDGVWEGTVLFPQGAEAGVWELTVLFVDGYRRDNGARVWSRLITIRLEERGWPYEVTVTAG